ncbi:LpqB family beta-propeller domain-containing protein [Actinoplanes solisilvae]|uniref:LpqB family beta-propeller domain-containing protein n=1 Tax=Actinoplanes solisilvae TaxID=2486853 RepID=UPI000FDBBDBD|nr:LpqB family beta-propeller domain-containing protein [Actinoplanes solisilvae]
MKRRLCAVLVLGALLLGGCGIPDESSVTVVGDGPSGGGSVGVELPPPTQYTRENATDTESLADYYLQAAAGDPGTALDRVKTFLAPDEAARFSTGNDIKIVREVEEPNYSPGQARITFRVQVVGTLTSDGVLHPQVSTDPVSYTFEVGSVQGRTGLYLLNAPAEMLMTDKALESFYYRRTIYWWNNDNTGLVPDLRYMPRTVPGVQQPTTILDWLTGGPSPWLREAVHSLPQGTQLADNVPAINNDTLEVNLNEKAIPQGADAGAIDRLRRQLQWSIRPLKARTVVIKIGRNDPVRSVDGEFLDSNPAYRLADAPERFAVQSGVIRRLMESPHVDEPVPLIKPAANKNVASAAFSASPTRTYAALVTGSGDGRKLRVAQAPQGEQADLKEVGLLSGALGVPVWAQVPAGDVATRAIGLITMNNKLYSFDAVGSRAQPVEWPGAPGPISAIAVAPDGYRVAVTSGGRLYRATLDTSGDGVALNQPEQVLAPKLKTVTAVAWSSETYLVVAGALRDAGDERYAVLDMTIDGALSKTRLDDIGSQQVTYLTAYPSSPVNGGEWSDSESYMAGTEAYDVLSVAEKITVKQLAGPAPSPSSGGSPTAPFFLG